MKISKKHTLLALLALAAWVAVGASQQASGPEQGTPLKMEGEITSLSMTAPGPPSLTVKNSEGVEYLVHFGPLRMLQSQGFNPKVGEAVTVSGFVCCEVENKQMVHSSEIILGGRTYTTPMTREHMMRMAPGACPGPNMRGGAAQGAPQGAMNCPNCPNPMQGGMHHNMHRPMHHPEMHQLMHH